MGGNNVKKDDENGQLSCGIYSSPAAARLYLQRLSRLSLDSTLLALAFLLNWGSVAAVTVAGVTSWQVKWSKWWHLDVAHSWGLRYPSGRPELDYCCGTLLMQSWWVNWVNLSELDSPTVNSFRCKVINIYPTFDPMQCCGIIISSTRMMILFCI